MTETDFIQSKFLTPCKIKSEQPASFIMLIFGGTGDLSQKKLLPALYQLFRAKLIKNFSIIAIGRSAWSMQEYRNLVAKSLKKHAAKDYKKNNAAQFAKHLFYQSCDVNQPETYGVLCGLITKHGKKNKTKNVIYYLAVQPSLVMPIVTGLSRQHLCREKKHSKIVLEKPFGVDQKSSRKLNQKILKAFDEKQIYRIDHYLGKETVQNILFFRYANTIFEPIWNRDYIDHVQITVAEDAGVGSRGQFYEEAGVIRDIVQNHLLQLIAMVAMDPPVGWTSDLIRDERVKIFQAIQPVKSSNIKVAQYNSYRREKNVAKNSLTATFFAGKFYLDNWRWAKVPFYVQTGKKLAQKITQIVVQFKVPPLKLLGRTCDIMQPNKLIFQIQPQESISMQFCVKQPGALNVPQSVLMSFDYVKAFNVRTLPAYNRLLLDCMHGDQTLFARFDEVEAMWSVVDPIIKYLSRKRKILTYRDGSLGPKKEKIWINE
ncbi:MAG: glucose-6-phosphate dehydrogenase [Gammaproteobacteria bacterium]|jgi:glucose-6-phosphate 1-dehydrogenase